MLPRNKSNIQPHFSSVSFNRWPATFNRLLSTNHFLVKRFARSNFCSTWWRTCKTNGVEIDRPNRIIVTMKYFLNFLIFITEDCSSKRKKCSCSHHLIYSMSGYHHSNSEHERSYRTFSKFSTSKLINQSEGSSPLNWTNVTFLISFWDLREFFSSDFIEQHFLFLFFKQHKNPTATSCNQLIVHLLRWSQLYHIELEWTRNEPDWTRSS